MQYILLATQDRADSAPRAYSLSRGRKPYDYRAARMVLAGYTDAHAAAKTFSGQTPFPEGYDAWPRIDQINYETGRLNTVNIRAAGLTLPNIRAITPQNYARYRDLREAAIQKIGPASPALSI